MKKTFSVLIFTLICFSVGTSQNLDINWLRKINLERNKQLDNEFRFITNTATPVSIAAPIGMLTAGLIGHNKELTKKAYVAGASIILSTILSTSLKYTIHRKRPFDSFPEIEKVSSAGSPSFPSGHTSAAFATATTLSIAFPKWYVIAPAYLYAGAVAYSRMHLGVHYPTDILIGMVVGAGSSFLCYKAQNWIK